MSWVESLADMKHLGSKLVESLDSQKVAMFLLQMSGVDWGVSLVYLLGKELMVSSWGLSLASSIH